MKTLLSLLLLCWLHGYAVAEVQLDFYYQPGCHECDKVKMLVLPRLEEAYAGKYRLSEFDIGVEANFLQLVAIQEALQADGNEPVSLVINNRIYLAGFDEIDQRLLPMVEQELSAAGGAAELPFPAGAGAVESRASGFTVWAIILAGVVDGVNPCVFATLVFFMSLLTVSRITGRKLFWVGVVYCAACFLSYLALGFGLFRILKLFSGYHTLQAIIEYGMIVLLLVFAAVSLLDACRFRRSGRPSDVTLQLPDQVKEKIHTVMHRGLKARYLLPGTFVIGVLVTALESVCTGQVYVPTLVLMTREHGGWWMWWLLLYNFMFILPLLAVFAVVWRGVNSQRLLQWSKSNVVWGKLSLAGLFLLLATLMWWLQ